MFRVMLEADYALFTRPESKVERVTYSVPTPSAMVGLLKSVFWKPAIEYKIHKIIVFNKFSYASVRRNEVTTKVLGSAVISQMSGKGGDPVVYTKEQISQRASLLLKDVKYGLEFSFELTGIRSERDDNGDAKYAETIRRRLRNGQCFRQPCMGCREFPVRQIKLVDEFELSNVHPSLYGVQDLGYMLYAMRYADDERKKREWKSEYFSDKAEAEFYHAYMVNGVIDVDRCRREK